MLPADTDDFRMSLGERHRPIAEVRGVVPFNHLCQQRKALPQFQPYHQGADIRTGHDLGEWDFPSPLLDAGEHIVVGQSQLRMGGQVLQGDLFLGRQRMSSGVDHLKLLLLQNCGVDA